MANETIKEQVRVLFHLNGYTKVSVERAEGLGLADGGIVWDIPTERIPLELRKIGSRFVLQVPKIGQDENVATMRNRLKELRITKLIRS